MQDDHASTAESDRRAYRLRPLVMDVRSAHREGWVVYQPDGVAIVRPPMPASSIEPVEPLRIPPSRQFPAVRATFDDLNKALSRLSNSPLLAGGQTLRQLYEEEQARYEELCVEAWSDGRFEPDYGSYVLDLARGDLYIVAPEQWHRLALVTSNAMLLADPEVRLAWQEVRRRLEGAVVGFVGLSVGGNVLEGWLREARPQRVKLADPDWVEVTNFNRGERMSLRHIAAPRSARFDVRNPFDTPRVAKAEYIAYEQHLVDPYATFFVYGEGVTRANIDRFLLGDGAGEPRVDIVVEEMDDLEMKVLVRERCRAHGIDVLMLSDFGHRVHVLWNCFRGAPDAPIAFSGTDAALYESVRAVKSGERSGLFEFIEGLCGGDFAADQFQAWMLGQGEQPTSSLPQSGATAMASGAIGGKELALHVLGHQRGARRRVIYDLLSRRILE